jgi:hypothetical protein
MPNYLLTYRWGWYATEELGLHTLTVASPETDPLTVASEAWTSWVVGFESVTNMVLNFAQGVTYNRASAAEILDLSTGALAAAAHHTPTAVPMTGTRSAPQCAVGISLTAGVRPNGTPMRGRFFLPPPSPAILTTDGVIDANRTQAFANFAATWLDNLTTLGHIPQVWSRTLGVVQPVGVVRAGNVVDTIRSRRNQIPEAYSLGVPA